MKTMYTGVSALALMSGIASGQVPSTNDTSDQYFNTGMGTGTLQEIISGQYCAYGYGCFNTAAGSQALHSTTSGYSNSALGNDALYNNSIGFGNTALGDSALYHNTGGYYNMASGSIALYWNSSGYANTATGHGSLVYNTSGNYNTAIGFSALRNNTIGHGNVGSGANALYAIKTGTNNIAMGFKAGFDLTGSNNIDIGNEGSASDSGVIRIGTVGTHTGTAIAGIYGTSVSGGVEVVIDSKGKLGVKTSARRYKDDIRGIGDSSSELYQLRPVTFRYKEPEPDGKKPVQYGLIAEEVAKVYPELVIRDEHGKIQGVRYEELAPMLLNEMQKEHAAVATLFSQHETDMAKLDSQAKKIGSLEQQLAEIHAALAMKPKDLLVAQR